jgi:hypothetical protein
MQEDPTQSANAGQQMMQLPVDISDLKTIYANFFRVVGTFEELIIDTGLHTQQQTAQGTMEPVRLNARLVLNYYTAKRLLLALQQAVSLHERRFGLIEPDVRKRMQGGGGIA